MPHRTRPRTHRPLALAMLGLLTAACQPAADQAATGAPEAGMDNSAAAIAGVRQQYESVRDYILTTARNVPETALSYRPNADVRTLSQLLGHVADGSYSFCSAALGEDSPAPAAYEQETSREALVAGLEGAFAYCDRAHAELAGPRLFEEVSLFGQTGTRLWVLVFNATHDWEHYGNLVTYMRLNDIVPPSSGGMSGQ